MRARYAGSYSERAAIIPLAAILATVMICLVALAVDGFRVLAADQQQHNNAEYGAEGAAKAFFIRGQSLGQALDRAKSIAVQNVYIGTNPEAEVHSAHIGLYPPSPNDEEGTLAAGCWNPASEDNGGQEFTPQTLDESDLLAALNCAGGTLPAMKLTLNPADDAGVTLLFAHMMGFGEVAIGASAVAYLDQSLTTNYPIVVTHES